MTKSRTDLPVITTPVTRPLPLTRHRLLDAVTRPLPLTIKLPAVDGAAVLTEAVALTHELDLTTHLIEPRSTRAYCDQPHPGSDAEADRYHELHHR